MLLIYIIYSDIESTSCLCVSLKLLIYMWYGSYTSIKYNLNIYIHLTYIYIYTHLNHIPWFPFVFFRISVLFCSRGLELGLPMAQFFNFRVPFLFPRHGSFLETETIWNFYWGVDDFCSHGVKVEYLKMPWFTPIFSPFKDAVFGAPPAWHCRSFQTQVSHFASDPGRIGYWKRFKKTWTCEVNNGKYISMII